MTDITAAEAQGEIERIRQERATKGGRMSNAEKDRIADLERIAQGFDETAEEGSMAETTEAPEGMKRIMIMNSNAGMPNPGGRVIKIFQFDVVETTAEHADALCAALNSKGQPMARETQDPVTIVIEDGKRVPV